MLKSIDNLKTSGTANVLEGVLSAIELVRGSNFNGNIAMMVYSGGKVGVDDAADIAPAVLSVYQEVPKLFSISTFSYGRGSIHTPSNRLPDDTVVFTAMSLIHR